MKPRDLAPLQKFAKASASCSKEVSFGQGWIELHDQPARLRQGWRLLRYRQAAIYGACVNAKYLEVERDMCKVEFQAFKDCVMKAVSGCALKRRQGRKANILI